MLGLELYYDKSSQKWFEWLRFNWEIILYPWTSKAKSFLSKKNILEAIEYYEDKKFNLSDWVVDIITSNVSINTLRKIIKN